MKVLVLGGTGRTGRLIADTLVTAGHDVIVAGRRDPQIAGARFLAANLLKPDEVRDAAQGMDAVVSALASDKGNPVCSTVAKALGSHSRLRFVSIGGGGIDDAGDNKGLGDKVIGWIMRRVVAEMLADRQAELAILKSSALRWTMLRPPRLTNGPASGAYRFRLDRPASTAISRADLARATVAALSDDGLVDRAPFVAG